MPPTTLAAGDIAIIAYNSEKLTGGTNNSSNDGISFVLFTDIDVGTVIKFTDSEWTNTGFSNEEGAIEWTATSALTAGTVVRIEYVVTDGAETQSASSGTVTQMADAGFFNTPNPSPPGPNVVGEMSISSSGDQIIAYQGTAGGSVTPITAFTNRPEGFVAVATASVTQIPTGLNDNPANGAVTAFHFVNTSVNPVDEFDNGYYNGPNTGSEAFLRTAIYTASNWVGSNTGVAFDLSPSAFTIGGPPTPQEIRVSSGSTEIVDGDTTPSFLDDTAFGATDVAGGTISVTYTISNTGGTDLTIDDVTISGAHASDFTITSAAPGTIAPAASGTFTVEFDPSAGGTRNATITIENNDGDENPYTFDIQGSGALPTTGTSLSAGDVAFIGFNDNNDEFAFVLLADIVAGTVIKFTDGGWTGTTFLNSEGAVEWTAPRDMSTGEVVFYNTLLPNGGPDFQPTDEAGFFTGGFSPSSSGDTLIAFQGTADATGTNVTNLAAIHYDGPVFDAGATDGSESAVPAGLTDGVNALSFGKLPDDHFDSGVWSVSLHPNVAALRAAINNEANWVGSDAAGGQMIPTGPIQFGSPAPEIDVQGEGVTIVDGDVLPSNADGTAFGGQAIDAGQVTQTFVVRNVGSADLDVSSVTITGTDAAAFSITSDPSGTIAAGGTANLVIAFDPSTVGLKEATITLNNDDADENPFTFDINGVGQAAGGGTTLSAGDVAITGYNTGTPDEFTFALLEPIAAGTVLKFTDAGWDGTTFRDSEGALEWTALTAMNAGQVVKIGFNGPTPDMQIATIPNLQRIDDGYFIGDFTMTTSGDQIIVYQGTADATGTNVTNLWALQYDKNVFDTVYSEGSGISLLPAGLTDGTNALSFGSGASGSGTDFNSGVYTGPTNLSFSGLRAAIADETNWTGSANSQVLPTTALGGTPPSAATVPASITVLEEAASDVDLSSIVLSDGDASGDMTVAITATDGTLSGVDAGGVTAVQSNANQTLTLTGTLAELNTYFDTASNIQYTGASNDSGVGADTLTLTLNDLDGTGNVAGGSVSVNITDINDPPTLTATPVNPSAPPIGIYDVFSGVTVSTIEPGQTITDLTLSVTNVTDGADEILFIDAEPVTLTNGTSAMSVNLGLTIDVTLVGTTATVAISGGTMTPAEAQSLVDTLSYGNAAPTPTIGARTFQLTEIVDDGASGAPNDNTGALNVTSTVTVEEPPSLVVTTTADVVNPTDGETSLREALQLAATMPNDDLTITFANGPGEAFASGGTITLASALPTISRGSGTLTIDGTDAGVVIDASGATNAVTVSSLGAGITTLDGLTIQNAQRAVQLSNGELLVKDSIFANNAITGSNGSGSAIFALSTTTLRIESSTFDSNTTESGASGGAIATSGFVVITGSTFVENSGGTGAAVFVQGGIFDITNSTFVGNSTVPAGANPGAVLSLPSANGVFLNNTVTGNDGASLIGLTAGSIDARDNILVGNGATALGLVGPTVASDNLTTQDPADIFAAIDPVTGGGVLADNGGPVQTVALKEDSSNPALDFGIARVGLLVDANGNPREVDVPNIGGVGETTDAGAVELQALGDLVVTLSPNSIRETDGAGAATGTVMRTAGTTGDLVVTLTSSDTSEATVPATVTIMDGDASATFQIAAVDDGTTDGAQQVTITATAPITNSGTATLTVTENEPPSVSLTTLVDELSEAADVSSPIKVADVVITDDGNGTNTLSIRGADSGSFELVGTELFLRAGADLDFEQDSELVVFVDVDDASIGSNRDDTATFTLTLTDANDPPELRARDVVADLSEDADTTAPIKLAELEIDDDALGTNTLSLSGTDAALFEITGDELFLKAGVSLDFETQSSLSVRVEVDDPDVGATPDDFVDLTFGVTDANEAPSITIIPTDTSVPETNFLTSLVKVGDVVVTDDALGSSVLGLAGPNSFLFELRGTEVFLRSGQALDFETQTPLSVTVTVEDPDLPGGPQDSAEVTANIADVNEAPSLALANVVAALPEDTDTSGRTRVADIVVTDDAIGTNTLALTGTDAALFEIDGDGLFLRAGTALDFETLSHLNVTVTLDDPDFAGLEGAVPLALAITDVNEPPSVALLNVVTTLPEDTDTSARLKVADIDITDDALGTATLGLAGTDAAFFEIDGTELFLKAGAALDFESQPSLDVSVTVDDPALAADPDGSAGLSLAVTDVNEAPSLALANVTPSLPEDADTSARIRVADIVVTDDALGTNTLALTGADAALFEIDGDGLFLIAGAALDFETAPQLDVTVTLDDADFAGLEGSAPLALAITDVNEPPTVALLNALTGLAEDTDTTARVKVADIGVTDDALGTATLGLTGADAALFEIDGAELFLRAGTALDFESQSALDVSVTVDDPALAADPDDRAGLSLSITDVNEAPSLALANATAALAEDTDTSARIRVADIVVTDDALGTNTLALTGADAALFEIDGDGVFLIAGAALDFETGAQLDVTVTLDDADFAGLEGSAPLSIAVTDANDPPTVALLNALAGVAEDADTRARVKVADIAITDDALGTATLGLTGADAALFEIDGSELFLRAGTPLDFETQSSLDVAVTVDDPALAADPDGTAALSLAVTDVNEAPSVAFSNALTGVTENTDATARLRVADIVITDDALGTNTLALTGEDAALFEIDGDGLFLQAGAVLDAGATPALDVSVTVDDATLGTGIDGSADLSLPVANTVQQGTAGGDLLIGTEFADLLEGLGGNDTLVGLQENDTLDGGAGDDIAVFTAPLAQQVITFGPDGTTITGADGSSRLINVETLRFSDDPENAPDMGDLFALSLFEGVTGATEAQLEALSLLYIGLYDRAPDALGLYFWASELVGGRSMDDIAQAFIDSPEAIAIYGATPTMAEVVQGAYQNILLRSSDAAGEAFWTGLLDDGLITPAQFFQEFAGGVTSNPAATEDQATLADQIDISLFYAAIQGLSDGVDASAALNTYDTSDRAGSLQAAQTLIDGFAADAESDGPDSALIVQLVGLIEDPFSIA